MGTSAVEYVCPACKGELRGEGGKLVCPACSLDFSNEGRIPDFATAFQGQERPTLMGRAYGAFFNFIAPVYESWAWYQLTLNLSGARESSIESIARFVAEVLDGVEGAILDIACGPATYGRRIVSPQRRVYGVDLSPGMLRQGAALVAREGRAGVSLARSSAERLPFPASSFDAAICCGSFHLFPDPVGTLREIGRAMKNGAPFALQTFLTGGKEGKGDARDKIGYHAYEEDELRDRLVSGGFEEVRINRVGTVLLARSRKAGH